jgi:hypothetical protein
MLIMTDNTPEVSATAYRRSQAALGTSFKLEGDD